MSYSGPCTLPLSQLYYILAASDSVARRCEQVAKNEMWVDFFDLSKASWVVKEVWWGGEGAV